jgi:hypothetical protein
MYDGVPTHGVLHEARMQSVFRQRMRIGYSIVQTLVMAILADGDNRDKVVDQLRALADEMFPTDRASQKEKEDFMAKVLREEGEKAYTVEALFER